MSRKLNVLAVLVVGCLIALSFMPTGALSAAPDKIKVGLMFGMTGAASPIGPLQLDGAKLAIKEINRAGKDNPYFINASNPEMSQNEKD